MRRGTHSPSTLSSGGLNPVLRSLFQSTSNCFYEFTFPQSFIAFVEKQPTAGHFCRDTPERVSLQMSGQWLRRQFHPMG